MRKLLLALVVSLAPSVVYAQHTPVPSEHVAESTPRLAAVALNAAADLRYTNWIGVAGRTQVTVYIEYVRGAGAATHVTMICWAGRTRKTLAPIPILYNSATLGTRDSVQHKWRQAVSADTTIRWIVTPLNDELLRCQIGSEGSVAGDETVAVYIRKGML
jgi:hypothetical protein